MGLIRRFLSRRWLLAVLGAAALLFGLAMAHPYPRQSLFGPKIRGRPWCAWEWEIREAVRKQPVWETKVKRWFGVRDDNPFFPGYFRNEEMLPLAIHLTKDHDKGIRDIGIWAIVDSEKLWQEPALPILREQLMDPNWYCRARSARAIWRISKDRQMITFTQQLLKGPQGIANAVTRTDLGRCEALAALAEMAAEIPELIPEVFSYAKDEDYQVRSTAMREAASFGKAAVPIISDGLRDPNEYVRGSAIQSLAKFGKDKVPLVVKGLSDPNESVRDITVSTLKAMGPDAREAVPGLLKLLHVADKGRQREIIMTLERIGIDPARRQELERIWVATFDD